MKKRFLLLGTSLMIVLALSIAGCSSGDSDKASDAKQGKDDAQQMAPKISVRTIPLAVTALMMSAGVTQLDDVYDEVDTLAEVKNVTAGGGAYSLYDYLDIGSYNFLSAFDIALDGTVSID